MKWRADIAAATIIARIQVSSRAARARAVFTCDGDMKKTKRGSTTPADTVRNGISSSLRRLASVIDGGREVAVEPAQDIPTVPLEGSPVPISIQATSRAEQSTRRKSLLKEPWTTHWVRYGMASGDVFYDIGANVGAYALLCARVHDHRVKVLAFEPAFANYHALCRNIFLNDCKSTVFPLPVLLHSHSGTTIFNYRGIEPGVAMHGVGERLPLRKPGEAHRDWHRQQMLTCDLDQLVERHDLPRPTHIKIDVDGGEPDILAGARTTLAGDHVKTVMIEMEPANREHIVDEMTRAGLSPACEFDKGNPSGVLDAFFARDVETLAATLSRAPARQSAAQRRQSAAAASRD